MTIDFTPPPGFNIFSDTAGVPGLLLMTGAFDDECERACFNTMGAIGPSRLDAGGRPARTGELSASPERFPLVMWAIINLIRDTGLAPWMCTPDYVLAWGYPPGTSFQLHSDSRTQWGEAVVGVTLGAPCELRFSFDVPEKQRPRDRPVDRRVWLPRGSIYIMTGLSRTDWKHGVFRTGKAGLSGGEDAPAPAWNPHGWRRSWTFRATKVYQLVALRRELRSATPATRAALVNRIAAQEVHYPPKKNGYSATCSALDIEVLTTAAERMLAFIGSCAAAATRIPAAWSRFPLEALPASVRALYEASEAAALMHSESSESTMSTDTAGQHRGFAISGFGGTMREVVGGGKDGDIDAPLGAFPQGYGLGFENARDGFSKGGGSGADTRGVAAAGVSSATTGSRGGGRGSLAAWLSRGVPVRGADGGGSAGVRTDTGSAAEGAVISRSHSPQSTTTHGEADNVRRQPVSATDVIDLSGDCDSDSLTEHEAEKPALSVSGNKRARSSTRL
jgi:hypothetical protein